LISFYGLIFLDGKKEEGEEEKVGKEGTEQPQALSRGADAHHHLLFRIAGKKEGEGGTEEPATRVRTTCQIIEGFDSILLQ